MENQRTAARPCPGGLSTCGSPACQGGGVGAAPFVRTTAAHHDRRTHNTVSSHGRLQPVAARSRSAEPSLTDSLAEQMVAAGASGRGGTAAVVNIRGAMAVTHSRGVTSARPRALQSGPRAGSSTHHPPLAKAACAGKPSKGTQRVLVGRGCWMRRLGGPEVVAASLATAAPAEESVSLVEETERLMDSISLAPEDRKEIQSFLKTLASAKEAEARARAIREGVQPRVRKLAEAADSMSFAYEKGVESVEKAAAAAEGAMQKYLAMGSVVDRVAEALQLEEKRLQAYFDKEDAARQKLKVFVRTGGRELALYRAMQTELDNAQLLADDGRKRLEALRRELNSKELIYRGMKTHAAALLREAEELAARSNGVKDALEWADVQTKEALDAGAEAAAAEAECISMVEALEFRLQSIVDQLNAVATNATSAPEKPVAIQTPMYPAIPATPREGKEGKAKIVILGSGWAGISAVKALKQEVADKYDIVLISPRNYFLYTPLLPAVAAGTCEERSIVEPVRILLEEKAEYYEAVCQQVDIQKKRIIACFPKDSGLPEACFEVPYDILVVAVGSTTSTFGCPGVEDHCLFFKTMEDAKRLRLQISECFERAALPYTSDEEKKKLLSFVVVGGGPTGVEVAAEMYDMINENLEELYPELMPFSKIKLIDSKENLLGTYDRAIGIELITNSRVTNVTATDVTVLSSVTKETQQMEYGICIWATGIQMSPLVKQIQNEIQSSEQEHIRCLVTDDNLRVKGSGGRIYCLGDAGTIAQDRAQARAAELFVQGDTDGDGKLQLTELRDILVKGSKEFPQLAEYAAFLDGKVENPRFQGLARKVISGIRAKEVNAAVCSLVLGELDMESELTQEQFKDLLVQIDTLSGLRGLPATAQVAKQQGEYFAELLSREELLTPDADLEDVRPFDYKHRGSLAYIGQDIAVLDSPFGPILGQGIGYVWKGFETYGQFSTRNRVLVAMDWLRAKVLGRDISRI